MKDSPIDKIEQSVGLSNRIMTLRIFMLEANISVSSRCMYPLLLRVRKLLQHSTKLSEDFTGILTNECGHPRPLQTHVGSDSNT